VQTKDIKLLAVATPFQVLYELPSIYIKLDYATVEMGSFVAQHKDAQTETFYNLLEAPICLIYMMSSYKIRHGMYNLQSKQSPFHMAMNSQKYFPIEVM
jgi:hypothetical protein